MSSLIAILMMFGLAGGQELKVRERFTDARISHDQKIGLFVFKREHYYPGSIGILGPSTPDRYVVNVSIIGSYDMATGAVRVLQRRDHGNLWVHESRDFHIVDAFGSRALIADEGNTYWLDINSGALTEVPLYQESKSRGRGRGHYILVDEQGSLIIINKAQGQAMNYSAPEEIWLRRPNGEYERMLQGSANYGSFYGVKNSELYFYSDADRSYVAYNLHTRLRRKCGENEVPRRWAEDLTVDFLTSNYGSPQPTIGKRVKNEWIRHEAQIDTSKLH
ncbi:MAG TPA: hypothetical protein VGQ41_13575 [Pyrinomonadaceae bacterium]|jgi:hypothetical protein|nr:hypothetical protein [Pyrinomonadaceae bacterium]